MSSRKHVFHSTNITQRFIFQKEEFADLGAKQYYVEYQTDITSDRLMKLIPTYIPDSYLETTKAMEMWFQLIVHNLQKVILDNSHIRILRYFSIPLSEA